MQKLEDMVDQGLGGAGLLYVYYMDLGDIEKGVEWFERAYREKDPLTITVPRFVPEAFTDDPELIARMELPGMKELFDIRRAHIANGNGPKQ